MRRRKFLALFGSAAVACPLVARAQQTQKLPTVAFMILPLRGAFYRAAFTERLGDLGWADGRTIAIDYRWSEGRPERVAEIAAELVQQKVHVIVTYGGAVATLKQSTTSIPIVLIAYDPVDSGLVASLSQPGGNVTGFINIEGSMSGKWLELLREIAPHVSRVAFLFNPETAPYFEYYLKPFRGAAQSFGVEAIAAPVHDKAELESAIAAQAQQPNSGLIVMPDGFNINHRKEITSLTARYRFPAVYPH